LIDLSSLIHIGFVSISVCEDTKELLEEHATKDNIARL